MVGRDRLLRWLESIPRAPGSPQRRFLGARQHSTPVTHIVLIWKVQQMPSCVLAYSGGLDTSVILGWLQEEGYQVHAVYVDLGQPCEDREAILKKARDCGAVSARLVDAQEELCRDFAFPVLQWQAKYENIYLLGTSIARPLITKKCLQVAREVKADAYAPRGDGQGERSVPVSIGGRCTSPGNACDRAVAYRKIPPAVSRAQRDDRVL